MNDAPRLLLIDGHSMAYRAFFALPQENFMTAQGQYTNAVFGFTKMLFKLIADEAPTHAAIAFDVSRRSFRTERYEDYKATRSKSPEEFRGQVEVIKDVLDALRIVHVERPGFEADDLLATLSTTAAKAGANVLVCSGDRDALQLVNESVTVLYPIRGVSELARMTPDAVMAKYGVPPHRYPELAALVGEASDNLPGVPGVGPKTAAKWITNFDGLDNILARVEQVPGKAGESLRAHLDDVTRNRALNALVRDVDLDLSLPALALSSPDRGAVSDIFASLEFQSLHAPFAALWPGEQVTIEAPTFDDSADEIAPGQLAAWLEETGEAAGLIVNGMASATANRADSLAIARADGKAAWIDLDAIGDVDRQALASWLGDAGFAKIVHDSKAAQLALSARDWTISGVVTDTALGAYLLRPEQRQASLSDLCMRYLGVSLDDADAAEAQETLDFGDDDPAGPAVISAKALVTLADMIVAKLEDSGQVALLREMEQPVASMLARLERSGICIDMARLNQLRVSFAESVDEASAAAFEVLGKEINLNSPKQLQVVLFDELGMEKTRKTKSGYTTNAEALIGLYEQTKHPFLEHVLAYRDSVKLRQIVDGLDSSVQRDGRIHTTFIQTATATGRLSSAEPNLQNIPVRTQAGRQIREVFVPGDDYLGLLSADYSQIEMRIMAASSQDRRLIEAFRSGQDFHAQMAAHVFGVGVLDVTSEQRAQIKAMNYGLAYGLSSYGLSQQLKISRADASALMDVYFDNFGPVRDYLNGLVERARKVGYTETLFGRRRYLPDLNSSNRQSREIAERAALNAPIQGSAADVMKVAMLNVESALCAKGLRSRVLLQVHDELIIEVAKDELDLVQEITIEQMRCAVDLDVELDVSVGFGPNWQEAAH